MATYPTSRHRDAAAVHVWRDVGSVAIDTARPSPRASPTRLDPSPRTRQRAIHVRLTPPSLHAEAAQLSPDPASASPAVARAGRYAARPQRAKRTTPPT